MANKTLRKTTPKKPPEPARVQIRASVEEIDRWVLAADRQGRNLSNWIRRTANRAADDQANDDK